MTQGYGSHHRWTNYGLLWRRPALAAGLGRGIKSVPYSPHELPAEVDEVLLAALQRNPKRRPAAAKLAQRVEPRPSPTPSPPTGPKRSPAGMLVPLVILMVLIAGPQTADPRWESSSPACRSLT